MSTTALQSRLKELSGALGQIHPLIDRLRNFTASIGQGDEARLELGAEIHSRLKEAEEDMELLRDEVEALESGTENRRKTIDDEKEAEKERVISLAGRLEGDLKRTRTDFRNAQLQAKKNAEVAKRKERELLFSRSQTQDQKRPTEKLTQDELELNAAGDVTAALRRTHQLMQAELSRSRFAQETLEQSTAALSSLSESYTSLDTLLSSSRNLLGSLLRSQKSDTWYLETAFYILIGTIIWLVFRRILYGPLWWLVWLPIKLIIRFTLAVFGAVGLTSRSVQSAQSSAVENTLAQETPIPALSHSTATAESSASWDQAPASDERQDSDRMIDQIGEMAETDKQDETNIKDISEEERKRQEEIPRNTKKRMFEGTDENRRDEL
ncbi:hypothetical protein PHISCL_03029 [Aspergillus sclerotialis]|uniref:Sec20 C-terminal domain-containing protein n=1 Tax=Aspergillus sclerotialis TaxID=2070753 RepID=A0A3A3A3J9_9EURO|nr:hypothetical protein PHISCL_03029 [Aspergillus sclerotialis]